MNVIPSRKQQLAKENVNSTSGTNKSNVGINLYEESPVMELSLDQFEIYALKRLKALRKIEQLRLMRSVTPDQARIKINELLKVEELTDPTIDTVSHFILRLSYCQTEELRRWFLNQECYLFQHRLHALSQTHLANAVQTFCQLQPITNDQKERISEQLLQLMNPTEFASTTFYKVPFTQALDLVELRQCFLHMGYAYVPQAKAVNVLMLKFRSLLSHQLALLANAGTLGNNADDPETTRVYPLLKNLNQCLVSREPTEYGDLDAGGNHKLTPTSIASYKSSMPLCMRAMYMGLEQDKHLKHWARLQFGLFLKHAGMSMDDTTMFFQRHFQKVTGEQFQKNYAYMFRFMYGKEGQRTDYSAYGCNKMIMGNSPSAGEHHGCPYKHYDEDHLMYMLTKLNIGSPKDRKEILELKKQHNYQFACAKQFQVQHPKAESFSNDTSLNMSNVGNLPNAWFRASVQYNDLANVSGPTSTSSSSVGALEPTPNTVMGTPGAVTSNTSVTRMEVSP